MIATHEPSSPRKPDGEQQEPHGKAVGQPHHRCLGRLRRLHQAHDGRIGALCDGPRGHHVKRHVEAGRAAQHRVTHLARHRHGLARQNGLVQQGPATHHLAINRHNFPLAHQNAVPRHQYANIHFSQLPIDIAQGFLRRAAQQGIHFRARPCLGKIFQQLAAGIHQ